MDDEVLYIKPNLAIEGLVDQFYAWLQLIPPATAAMNLANLHLPMIDSYIQSPQVHAAAVANPKMKGGFFIDYKGKRVEELKDLKNRIIAEDKSLLGLARAIKDTEELLRARASGYDLTALYQEIPEALRGYVELVYDLNHHASLRFLESSLYRSRFHREARQSVDIFLEHGSQRSFILSTPRLPKEGHLHLPLPLRHEGIAKLFAMRTRPQPFEHIRDTLEISQDFEAEQLREFLTAEPMIPRNRTIESGGRIRYFGHACLLLQNPDVSIIVDPCISANCAAGDRFTYADLPEHIDFCLITHGHQDHIVTETMLQLRGKVDVVVVPRTGGGQLEDPSLRLYLEHIGFTVREVEDFDEFLFSGGRIISCPFLGEHCDLNIRGKSTYLISLAGRTFFIAADSSGIEPNLYRAIHDTVGPADVAFIGMECDGAPLTWLYGGLFTQAVSRNVSITRKLSGSNAVQALDIAENLRIKEAYVYAMGEEDWLQHIMATSYTPESYQLKQIAEFLEACTSRGIKAEHLLIRKEFRW
jgi:L-ascorbate metabolism protein UlaG (beta-lactamase superfamily)